MKNIFNSVQLRKPQRSTFDLSHDVKLTLKMGELVPVCNIECVPGDKINLEAESLIRFAPLVSPVMHRMDVTVHYFFVPNRILWDGWEDWINVTSQRGDTILTQAPYMNISSPSRLPDFLGVPSTGANPALKVSALPFAAYQKIYDEFYRDQNLIDPVFSDLTKVISGDNTASSWLRDLRTRCWEHDYFTSCLPYPQKGDDVAFPLAGIAEVKRGAGTSTANHGWKSGADPNVSETNVTYAKGLGVASLNDSRLYTDFSTMQGSATIRDVRRAHKLQEWLERNALSGNRYAESILAHFGVKSSDARLQRPEYITGVKAPVTISEVLNTTGETSGLPQGNMAGHGISVAQGANGSYRCEEHGIIMGIMSVMPKTAYQQGLHKSMQKFDQFDYYWPSFANIGEQEVKVNELFVDTTTVNRDATFGYIPRYAEYKYMPSRVCGAFKSTLDFWHLGRVFATLPALNKAFVECIPDTRIFAVEDGTDPIFVHILNKIIANRPMPYFGTPQL